MAPKLTCLCNCVSESKIRALVRRSPMTLEDVRRITGAGSSCGRCQPLIAKILSETPPRDIGQGRLF